MTIRQLLCHAAVAAACALATATTWADDCAAETGLSSCQDAGQLTAGVSRVAVADRQKYGGANPLHTRTVTIQVRLHNTGNQARVLAYRERSLRVVDGNGSAYKAVQQLAREATGIGLAKGKSADPQLQLAPGEIRDVRFEAEFEYYRNNHAPFGDTVDVAFTLAELRLPNATQMLFVRDHAITLPGAKVSGPGLIGGGGASGNALVGSQLLQDLHKLANRKK